jgi:preprotein translocase subunit SecE
MAKTLRKVSKKVPSRALLRTFPQLFSKTGIYLREVSAELKKVSWPDRETLISYTIVVLIAVLIIGAYIGLIDLLFLMLVDLLAGLRG